MATLHELRSQIDQGKSVVLFFKNEDAENVMVFIRKDVREQYTHTVSYPDRPNPFPQPRTERYSSWEQLFEDIKGLQTTSELWYME